MLAGLKSRDNVYSPPPVSDKKTLPEALKIILDHLKNTIYEKARKKFCDYVLST
jgi:hypothetical protein